MTKSAHLERSLAGMLVVAVAAAFSAHCGRGGDVNHQSKVLTRELESHQGGGQFSAEAYAALAALRRRDVSDLPPTTVAIVASALLALRQPDEAAALVNRALAASPRSSVLSASLAVAVWVRNAPGDRVEAFDRTLRALDVDPDHPDLLFNAAHMADGLLPEGARRQIWLRYVAGGDTVSSRDTLRLPVTPHSDTGSPYSGDRARGELLDRLLPAWATACLDGDGSEGRLRARIEAISSQAVFNEDRFVDDIVTRLRAPSPGTQCDTRVARQLVRYTQGRDSYRRDDLLAAEPHFRAVADDARGVPALALSGRLFAAIASYFSGHQASARREFDAVAAEARRAAYFEIAGRAEWMRAYGYDDEMAYEEAVRTYDSARAAFERANSFEGIALADGLQASALDWLGEYRDAWRLRERAMMAVGEVEDWRARGTILTGVIRATSRDGWQRAALEFATAKLLDPATDRSDLRRAQALLEVGELQATLKAPAAAGTLREAGVVIGRLPVSSSRKRLEARLLQVRARLERNPKRAAELITQALESYREAGTDIAVARLFLARARAHARAQDNAAAEADLRAGIGIVEKAGSAVGRDYFRISYFDEVWDLFDELVELRVRQGDWTDALRIVDQSRGRELRKALRTSADAGPISRVTVTPVAYYAVLPTRVVVWIITAERTMTLDMPVSRERVTAAVKAFAACVAAAQETLECESSSLWKWLVVPVLQHTSGDALTVVPDPVFQMLPFAALRDPSTGRYLIEERQLRFAPSLDRVVRHTDSARPTRALVVGNPLTFESSSSLPDAVDEAREVASAYTDPTLLIGRDASRSRFLNELPSAQVVHFAGHAILDPEVPSLSRLLMTPDPDQRGSIYAHEIQGLRLRPSVVVVLAACDTAVGRTYRSEGTASLARAFLAAGAGEVVATMWPVEDAAARSLFVTFHREMRDGKRAPEGLRRAQVALLRSSDPALRRPAAWASAIVWSASVN